VKIYRNFTNDTLHYKNIIVVIGKNLLTKDGNSWMHLFMCIVCQEYQG